MNTLQLFPASAGALAQTILGAGSDTVTAVQTNDGGTSYVYVGAVSGDRSSSFFVDGNGLPPHVQITGLTINCYCALDTGTPVVAPNVNCGVRISATNYLINMDQDVSGQTYTLYSFGLAANPNTAAAWTKYDLDSLELLLQLNGGTGTAQLRCTQIYVDVEYEPTTDALLFGS